MISARRVRAEVKGTARTFVRGRFGLYTAFIFPLVLLLLLGSVFGSADIKYVDYLIPGLVGFSMLSPMFALVNIASAYKRDKVFKELALTPLTRGEWLLGKVLWYIMITIPALILMALVGTSVFGAQVTLSIYLLPFLIVGPFLFVSLGMLIAIATNVESQGVVTNLVTFPMMFLSGIFYPVSMMPAWAQAVAHVFPLFYILDGLNDVMISGNPGSALVDLVVTLVIALVFFGLAVRLFKWRED